MISVSEVPTDKRAAKRLLRKLLKKQTPRVMITDPLASYGAATRGS
jgi:transposase-like protein